MKQRFTAGPAVGRPASPARVLRAVGHLSAGHGLFSVCAVPQSQPGHAIDRGGLCMRSDMEGSTHPAETKKGDEWMQYGTSEAHPFSHTDTGEQSEARGVD